MGLIDVASGNSVWRGLDYAKSGKIKSYKQIDDDVYTGIALGSNGEKYNVFMDVSHPRKSKCDCPHAKDRRIVCKHIVALYFTVFPKEIDKFLKKVEEAQKEYEAYEEELEIKLHKYIKSMSKAELQETVLQLLYEGPEWMYDRFIRDRIEF